jgi:lysozyme
MRRWLLTLIVVAVVGGLVPGIGLWFGWLPHYRPGLQPGERYGIDVSSYQGDIDWPRVADADVAFAYIKATEGGTFTDDQFRHNWDAARAAGIKIGAYHFFTLCRSGAEQATHFLATVPRAPGLLPAAIDLELPGNCRDRPPQKWLNTQLVAFVATVEKATGQPLVFYVGDSFADRYELPTAAARPLWRRQLLRRPAGDRWWIWQCHNRASIEGIAGAVDLNVMRDELR